MSIFQKSVLGYFLATSLCTGILVPQVVAETPKGELKDGFPYHDRLLFAVNVFNIAADAFNSGSVAEFMRVFEDELEDSERKSFELVLQGEDRLPNAYVVGGDSIKFYFLSKGSFEEAGFTMDFSSLGEGLIKVNGQRYSYNQTRTHAEWVKLFESEQGDVSMFFDLLVPQAHAKKKNVFAQLGAAVVGLVGGGRNKKAKSRSAPVVARKPIYVPPSKSHRSYYRFSGSKSTGVRSSYAAPTPSSRSHQTQTVASRTKSTSEERVSSASRRSDYVRTVASSTGSKVGSVARSLWGHYDYDSWPSNNLKCAKQASTILKRAGIINSTHYTVVGLVKDLKSKGWRVSSKPVVGAIAFSNPEFGTKSSRSHVGVVGSDMAVYHNSGAAGGKIIRSDFSDTDYNGRWLKGVSFLIPPDTRAAYFFQGGINVRLAYLEQLRS